MGKLTGKQALFAKHYATGKSGKQCAILAGYSKRSAQAIASENLTKPEVLKKINSILEAAGLSDEQLAVKLKKAIDAGLGKRASNSDALKGIRMAMELKDRFPTSQSRIELSQTSEIELKLQGMTNEELVDFLDKTTKDTQQLLEKLKTRHTTSRPEDDVKEEPEPDNQFQAPKAVGMPSTPPTLPALK
jgi:phage terminase small subunit